MHVKLKVLSGNSAGRELRVPSEEDFLIGRHDDCHLRPKSDAISRRHCVIRQRDGGVFVEDLGSRNGTYLDGVLIENETEARAGSVIRVGRLEFEIVIEKPVPVAEPQPVSHGAENLDDDSMADDDDITKWLEGDAASNAMRRDPETRQFRLDETERVALDTAVKNKEEETTIESAPAAEKTDAKKKPGKLPPRTLNNSANSREAAADMLKRFFNRP